MNTDTIVAKWKKAGRVFVLILLIGTFIAFVFVGLFADYEHLGFTSRLQMVLLMIGIGSICSLILLYLYLWVIFWKLEIKNNEIIITGFLKKSRAYKLFDLTIKRHNKGAYIKYAGKTIAGTSIMVENSDEVVRAIELGKS